MISAQPGGRRWSFRGTGQRSFDPWGLLRSPSRSPRSCRKASFSSRHSACTLFLTDAAVVALFGFFKELQMSFKTFLVSKASTVHAGQLVAVLVAVPVCTCEGELLEALQLASRGHVGASAEVFKVLARFASHVEAERAVATFTGESALSVPHTIVWVGYIARPPVRTCGTPARLLQPGLAPRVLSPRGHYLP